jgi:hypothetical protein
MLLENDESCDSDQKIRQLRKLESMILHTSGTTLLLPIYAWSYIDGDLYQIAVENRVKGSNGLVQHFFQYHLKKYSQIKKHV